MLDADSTPQTSASGLFCSHALTRMNGINRRTCWVLFTIWSLLVFAFFFSPAIAVIIGVNRTVAGPVASSVSIPNSIEGLGAADAGTRCTSDVSHILVTGITGLIGSHVARVLVHKPCVRVFGLVRPRSNLDTLVGILNRIELVHGDITDAFRMIDVMRDIRPDYVYHFAAQAINEISYRLPELTMDANVKGTLNLLEALRRNGLTQCRFLLAGSSTEYGRTADRSLVPIPETANLDPVSPYGVSKVAAEMLARQYHTTYSMPIVVARLFIQIGPGGTDSLAIQQFCRQIAMAEQGLAPPILLHGNLATSRDISDVSDTAPVLVALAERGIPGEAYNVGTQIPTSMQELLQEALHAARIPIETRIDPARFRLYDEKVLLSDNSKVRALTGWIPRFDRQQSVARILDYWRTKIAALYGNSNVQPAAAAAPNDCPFANVDLVVVVRETDFPLLMHMLHSLDVFMPCYGMLHVVCDDGDEWKLPSWMKIGDRVRFHHMDTPPELRHIPGYILQAWKMMWGDQLVSPTADYVMFLDTDTVFALPVTCASLFDDHGRPFIAYWPFDKQAHFRPACSDFVGECKGSFMAMFPMMFATSMFAPMRRHAVQRYNEAHRTQLGADEFDFMFGNWSRLPTTTLLHFSQFVVMGNYAMLHTNTHHPILFEPASVASGESLRWVPHAIHYGWRPCWYLDACPADMLNIRSAPMPYYSEKYGHKTIELIQNVVHWGQCLQHYLSSNRTAFGSGCDETLSTTLHVETKPYGNKPLDMQTIYRIYTPSRITTTLCANPKEL